MIAQHARPQYDRRKWALKKIHEVAARMRLDDDARRAWQEDLVGVASCADMTERQALKTLYALTHRTKQSPVGAHSGAPSSPMTPLGDTVQYVLRAGGRLSAPTADSGSVVGAHSGAPKRTGRDERLPDEAITREQLALIEHLREHVRLVSGAAWPAFCRRVIHRPWPQTRAQGNAMIEALKQMDARGWRAKSPVGAHSGAPSSGLTPLGDTVQYVLRAGGRLSAPTADSGSVVGAHSCAPSRR